MVMVAPKNVMFNDVLYVEKNFNEKEWRNVHLLKDAVDLIKSQDKTTIFYSDLVGADDLKQLISYFSGRSLKYKVL